MKLAMKVSFLRGDPHVMWYWVEFISNYHWGQHSLLRSSSSWKSKWLPTQNVEGGFSISLFEKEPDFFFTGLKIEFNEKRSDSLFVQMKRVRSDDENRKIRYTPGSKLPYYWFQTFCTMVGHDQKFHDLTIGIHNSL